MTVRITVADQQALATEVQNRLQSLDSNVSVADLVFLSRVVELFNGNANQSAVSQEGANQVTAVQSEATTQIANVNAAGSTQVSAVEAEGATQASNLGGLKDQIVADLNAFGMSPLKVFFLSQS